MQKNRIYKYLAWMLVFAFVCSSVFVTVGNTKATAAGSKNIQSVTVKVDGKNVTKKTVTLRKGKKTTLKVSVSPGKGKKHVTYASSKKSVAAVSKQGKVTAKKAGTAKIRITVSGKGHKKKTTWVKIRVVNVASDTGDFNTPVPNTPAPDVKPPVTENGKSLVVYFSRTGTTKAAAVSARVLQTSVLCAVVWMCWMVSVQAVPKR